eukprot:SAG22_NODE_123_length_18914_cov_28.993410_7_plen_61_part_00
MPAEGSFIVRLQHLYGSTEGLGAPSEPVSVDLASRCSAGLRERADDQSGARGARLRGPQR